VKQRSQNLAIQFDRPEAYLLAIAQRDAGQQLKGRLAMSRISALSPAQTEGKAKDILDAVQKGLGMVPNLFRVTAQSPAALEGLVGLNGALGKGALNAKIRERIALGSAERNGCDYCLSAHTALGKMAGLSETEIAQARAAQAADPKALAALRFAGKVADLRGQVSDADLVAVRQAGFSDAEIIEIVAHVALNFLTNTLNNVALTEIDFPVVRTVTSKAA
jgi:uncharacterized peroxidase-related enzyme